MDSRQLFLHCPHQTWPSLVPYTHTQMASLGISLTAFPLASGTNWQTLMVPYFLIPNQDVPIPSGKGMLELGRRVIAFFQEPGCSRFQVRASGLRGKRPPGAAMYGAEPGSWACWQRGSCYWRLRRAGLGTPSLRELRCRQSPRRTSCAKLIMKVRMSWRPAAAVSSEASRRDDSLHDTPPPQAAPQPELQRFELVRAGMDTRSMHRCQLLLCTRNRSECHQCTQGTAMVECLCN